uniref:Bestrophin homolog n=1 Tax=Panagrolaimus superbus TaxID=310955 RepID=A0A914XYD1_9BILA
MNVKIYLKLKLSRFFSSAIAIATFIRGEDDETRALRRTLIRYMILTQSLVLRDISLQTRKRFPALETLEAAGFCSKEELYIIENTHDSYSRYWIPIEWCFEHLYEAKREGKIESIFLLERITAEIRDFREGLAKLLKFDWVPVPLGDTYSQLVFLSVRLYFIIALFTRQFLRDFEHPYWFPIATTIQFIVYVGWLKVAEALLNPLGEDDDDLECNYVIDKNLITGMTLVDRGGIRAPTLIKDAFWDNEHITPLYSYDAANRTIYPLIGSASKVNYVKKVQNIIMTPHKLKLAKLNENEQYQRTKSVDISDHNVKHIRMRKMSKERDPNKILRLVRQRSLAETLENITTTAPTNNEIDRKMHERF